MGKEENIKQDTITIVAPNGATDSEKYRQHDTIGKTLDHAVKEFGKAGHLDASLQYILVSGDTPLENSLTLQQAGITAGATLKVRSKSIPGDGNAS
jgi:hypothetical protein